MAQARIQEEQNQKGQKVIFCADQSNNPSRK